MARLECRCGGQALRDLLYEMMRAQVVFVRDFASFVLQ